MSSIQPNTFKERFFHWTSEKTTRFTIIFIVLILSVWIIGSIITDELLTTPKNASHTTQLTNELVNQIIAYATPIVLMLILLLALGIFKRSGLTFKNLWKALWRLSFELVVALFVFILSLTVMHNYLNPDAFKNHSGDLTKLIMLNAAAFLCTGLFEEILYRGFVMNGLLSHWGNSRKGVIKAVVISAVLFGVLHMINLMGWIDQPDGKNFVTEALIPVIFQSFMAFTFGIYFGLVYLKTNNLLACIFMHAIFDFLLAVMELFENTNAPSTYALLLPAIILVFEAVGELGLSYFIFKKTDWSQITVAFQIN